MAPVNATTYHAVQSRDGQLTQEQQASRHNAIIAIFISVLLVAFILGFRPWTLASLRKLRQRMMMKKKKESDDPNAGDIELGDINPIGARGLAVVDGLGPSQRRDPAVCDLCGGDVAWSLAEHDEHDSPLASPRPMPSSRKFTPQDLINTRIFSGLSPSLQLALAERCFTMTTPRSSSCSSSSPRSHKVRYQRSFSVDDMRMMQTSGTSLRLPPGDLDVEGRRSDTSLRISATTFEPISYEGVPSFAVYKGSAPCGSPEQPAQSPQRPSIPQHRWPFCDVETDETDEGDSVIESISSLFSGFSGGPYVISDNSQAELASSPALGGSDTSVPNTAGEISLSSKQQSSGTQTLKMKSFSF